MKPLSQRPTLSPGQARVLRFLRDNANADGECYRYVAQIAEAVDLSRDYVRQVTSRFVKWGIISREQMWDLYDHEQRMVVEVVPAAVALGEVSTGSSDKEYHPAGNIYRILQPELLDGYYVNQFEQLSLPFPPILHEVTLLARQPRKLQPVVTR